MEAPATYSMTYAQRRLYEASLEPLRSYLARRHAELIASIHEALLAQLRANAYTVFASEVRVQIGVAVRVCDVLVQATLDDGPTLLVEVLSPSTEGSDRGDKWAHYQYLPTLREYVLVSGDQKRVEVFRRESDTNEWRYAVTLAGELTLHSIGVTLDLEALYREPLLSPPQG